MRLYCLIQIIMSGKRLFESESAEGEEGDYTSGISTELTELEESLGVKNHRVVDAFAEKHEWPANATEDDRYVGPCAEGELVGKLGFMTAQGLVDVNGLFLALEKRIIKQTFPDGMDGEEPPEAFVEALRNDLRDFLPQLVLKTGYSVLDAISGQIEAEKGREEE